jgi:hypothetical protein
LDVVVNRIVGDTLKIGLGPAIAVIGLVVGYYYFRANNRRKRILLDMRYLPLIASPLEAEAGFEVTVYQRVVQDPHVCEFKIENIGRKDVSSKDFDAEEPLQLKTGATVVTAMAIPESDAFSSLSYAAGGDTVEIEPTIFPVGKQFRARVLVDGKPEMKLHRSTLVDTDIVAGTTLRSRIARRAIFYAWLISAVGAATAAISAWVIVGIITRIKAITPPNSHNVVDTSTIVASGLAVIISATAVVGSIILVRKRDSAKPAWD